MRGSVERWPSLAAAASIEEFTRMIYTNRVGFADVDYGRIPFYGRYFNWLEDAWEAYLHHFDIWYSEVIGKRRIGVPLISLECRYRRTMGLDDQFHVLIRITELNRRGTTAQFRFVRDDGVVAVEGSFVRRFIAMDEMKVVELPDDLFESFEALAEALAEWPEELVAVFDG